MKKKLAILLSTLLISANSGEILQEQVNRDLKYIRHPNKRWIEPRKASTGEKILDVAIIGGGQTGLTMAFSLKQHNIEDVVVFDQNAEDQTGSWFNIGRMKTLRTPKTTTGPDLGIPILSVQSWYTAKFGAKAWEDLDYIPRLSWHDYLNWYRKVLKLPVRFNSSAGPIDWNEENQCLAFQVKNGDLVKTVFARKVILAVGLEGSGRWMIPDFVQKNVDKRFYTQAVYRATPDQLCGKDVAILGAGPNAFDLTKVAAEAGAKSISMFSKRKTLVNLHCFKWGEFTGFMKAFTDLSDEQKYNFIARFHEMGQPPVGVCVEAAKRLPNFKLHYSSPWKNVYQEGNKVVVETAKGSFKFDFLILATGWMCDLKLRPELLNFCSKIATWNDRYHPPEGRQYEKLLKFPYLGRGFQFTEKNPGEAPYLESIFNMTGGGLLSNGFCAGTGLTGMKYSIDLITHEIVKQLFLEDENKIYQSLDSYNIEDFQN